MTTKERLHQLIEELPESESGLAAVERFLEAAREAAAEGAGDDPVRWALDHAPEEEPTPEEAAAILAAKARLAAGGKTVAHEEARRRLLGHP